MKLIRLYIALLVLFLFSGCADSVTFDQASSMDPVGFWYGLWHGMIIFVAWIVSLFSDNVSIYAIYNNGAWYDFGFLLGTGGALGSFSANYYGRN